MSKLLDFFSTAGRNKKSLSRPKQTLTASAKLAQRLKLGNRKGGIKAATTSSLPPSSKNSTLAAATASTASTAKTKPRRAFPMFEFSRLRSLVGELFSAAAALLLLAAQVASLAATFYLATLRALLDLPPALASTALRSAGAAAADASSRAVEALSRRLSATLDDGDNPYAPSSRPARALIKAASEAKARALALAPVVSSLVSLFSSFSSSSSRFLVAVGRGGKQKQQPRCVFYECLLHHRRLRPAHHEFEYAVRMAFFDLDAPPAWFARKEGKNSSKEKREHLSASEARAAAGLLPSSKGAVWLLTMPPAAGYSQNPISVYYCYPEANEKKREQHQEQKQQQDPLLLPPPQQPVACVAEVTNTPWGSVARFAFDPRGDSVPKCLHVSPFMDMRNEWRLTAPGPGGRLALSVAALHPELGAFFTASLVGKVDADDRTKDCLAERSGSFRTLFKYAYGPQRVALWIYGHAAVLLLRKKLRVFGPPARGAGPRAVKEAAAANSSSSSSSSSSLEKRLLTGGLRRGERWHEWVAAREWPWRAAANGV